MKTAQSNKVILLNADHSMLHFVSFKRAVSLYSKNKVNIIKFQRNSKIIHPVLKIRKPHTIALKKYIYVPHRTVRYNRTNIFIRDDYKCQYCNTKLNKKNKTIDHVIPKSDKNYPGPTRWDNVVACCSKCNHKKANKTPEESGMKLYNGPPKKPSMQEFLLKCQEHHRMYL